MKKYFFNIILIFAVSGFLMAQEDDYFTNPYADSSYFQSSVPLSKNKGALNSNTKDNINVRLNSGASFATFGDGSVSSFHTAPGIDYKLSPKISVSTGVMVVNNNYNSVPVWDGEKVSSYSGSIMNGYVFASGLYRMNEKITVRASVVKEVGNLNQEKQINSQLYDSDYQGYSLGFNYKITDNMSIGGEISIDKGYNPFYYNQNSLYRGNSFGTSHYQSFPGNSFYGW